MSILNFQNIKLRKFFVLSLFSALLTIVSWDSFAQEASQSQAPNVTPGQKSTESPPPSLSSLLSQTVIFIYEDKTPSGAPEPVVGKVLGTAFLVGIPQPGRPDRNFPFIVTAKHVIADQTKVFGRYTQKSGTNPIFVAYNLETLRKTGDLWEYPNDVGVDIVVFRTLFYDNLSLPFPIELLASKDTFIQEHIDVTDRVIIPCLMENFPGLSQNYPIFRDGTIALITEEPISFGWKLGSKTISTTQRIIFINSVLNEGFSGAPAFLWPGLRLTPGGTRIGGKPWLLGIVHGFFPILRPVIDADREAVFWIKPPTKLPDLLGQIEPPRTVQVLSQENSGTGVLFPSWRLLDILQSDSVKERVQQLTDEENKSRP